MDYYHTDRTTLGALPFLEASNFVENNNDDGHWTSIWLQNHRLRGSPRAFERLQHLLHEQGKKRDGEEYELEVDGYVDRAGWRQVPLHIDNQNTITLQSKYKPRFRRRESNDQIPYHADLLPRWESFADSMKERCSLEGFKLDNIVLPPSPYLASLLVALNNNSNLLSLQLSSCELGTDGFKCIAKFLQKNNSLAALDVSGNTIEDVRATRSLAAAMKKHPDLSFLDVSKCNLGDTKLLSALLNGCDGLQSLILDNNDIDTKETVTVVAKFLAENNSLTVFSMDKNGMGNANSEILGNALKGNTKLRQLCLGSNGLIFPSIISSKDVAKHLVSLDLNGKWWDSERFKSYDQWEAARRSYPNKLKKPGFDAICRLLRKSDSALVELNLASTGIPAKAAELLASALKKNTTLQYLDLSCNSFNDNSVPSFLKVLKKNNTLLSLNLCHNNIRVKTGRVGLLKGICDASSLNAIAVSNHTCAITMVQGSVQNNITNEMELRKINSLNVSVGEKIRLKVVFAMFTLKTDLFDPRSFYKLPLELMPRLLDLVQHQFGFKGYGKSIVKRKSRGGDIDPTLDRIYQTLTEWNTIDLVNRGPGKLRKKSKKKKKTRKRKRFGEEEDDCEDDEEWTTKNRGAGF